MFEPGNVLYGCFHFPSGEVKNKYSIVLYNDGVSCIITTFTTSKNRSGSQNPVHGKNPPAGEPMAYVFLKGKVVGTIEVENVSQDFAFPMNTTIVPDYGYSYIPISEFLKNVENLEVKCHLFPQEYIDLIYTLYKCRRIKKEIKEIFEHILEEKMM